MGRETQKKGDIGKAKAIAKFTEMGYDVAVMITESAPYDLLVDTGEEIKRVSVKYFGGKDKPHLRLRKIHSNSQGYVVKRVKKNEYDWAYVYCADGREFLVREHPDAINAYNLKDSDLI